MKNLIYTFIIITSILFTTTYYACRKDNCKNVNCRNEGVCIDGNCSCAFMYEDPTCQTETRQKYFGIYRGDGINSDGDEYINWALKLYSKGNASQLGLDILTDKDTAQISLTIQMITTDSFKILPQINSSTDVTGYGTIHTKTAFLVITDTSAHVTINFAEMKKQ